MNFLARLFPVLFCTAVALVACSSAPVQKKESPVPEAQQTATAVTPDAVVEKPTVYRDSAHAAFIMAEEMKLRGLTSEADSLYLLAWRYDPESRYLAFEVAQYLLSAGADSLALSIAKQAVNLKGRPTASQYSTMAHLYVREGVADSARKYFVLALDSSKNQDMNLLYDYSLFLEAVQDKEELVRVYNMLLPQTNYIQSLFSRQMNLLVELRKDSALVEFFNNAYEATGNRDHLAQMVHALMIQKRFAEARAIADTITGSTAGDAMIVELALLTYAGSPKVELQKFLKKKYYEDHVRVPELLFHLGLNEYMNNEIDSAKAHLDSAHLKLDRDPSYGAQANRTLSAIAFSKKKPEEAVRYAEQADSILAGEGKAFLAIAYGTAKKFDRAYALLDSMLGVWSKWRPMEAIADSAQVKTLMAQAQAKYRRYQRTYADVLMIEARYIEKELDNAPVKLSMKDSLRRAAALEARQKAELFWESMLAEHPEDISVRFEMARNLERLNRIDESFAMFETILKAPNLKELNYAEVANYYGYTLLNLNRNKSEVEYGFELVTKALDAAKGEKPDAILDSKAWGLYRLGRYGEALETIKQIDAKKFEDDDEYLEHYASIQAAMGNKAEATKAFRKLLKLKPGHPSAVEFLKGKK